MEQKYKYILIICSSLFLIALIFYFMKYENKEELLLEKEVIKNEPSKDIQDTLNFNVTKKEKKIIKQKSQQEKKVIKEIEKEDMPPKIQKEKETILASAKTKDNKYFIKLKSDKKIKDTKITNYIPFRAKLYIDENIYSFNLSLNENYSKNNEAYLFLEVYSLQNNSTATCDGYFLKDLEIKNIYNLGLDSDGNEYLSCYIEDQHEISNFDLSKDSLELKPEYFPKEFLKELEKRKSMASTP